MATEEAASIHRPQTVRVHGDYVNLSNDSNRLPLAAEYWIIPQLGLEANCCYYKYFENQSHV